MAALPKSWYLEIEMVKADIDSSYPGAGLGKDERAEGPWKVDDMINMYLCIE